MMYNDEQIINNISTLNQMAKEYATELENKKKSKLSVPLQKLYCEQKKAQFCYNSLLRFAKQNAISLMQELLREITVNIENINCISDINLECDIVNEATNDYVKLFKDALLYEINSLKYCIYCENICKNDENCKIINNIMLICEKHITKLIACF